MYFAPVKSLGLATLARTRLEKPGIPGDRLFAVVDENGKLVTQRQHGPLVQIAPQYDAASGELRLTFPDGSVVAGVTEPATAAALSVAVGMPITAMFWDTPVDAHVVAGAWHEALSEFAGRPLRLIKAVTPGRGFDAYPISICSRASLDAFARAAEIPADDGRRFRQNLYLSGAAAHGEDEWLGQEVRVGTALVRVKIRDSRCVMTTHSPDTGDTDMDTLKVIASYRVDQPKEVNFGVYCTVAEPGEVAIGDEVTLAG